MTGKPKKSKNVLKLCILGEGGVGKTTLTRRILTGTFDATTKMTIGVDFEVLNTSILDPFADEDADDVEQIPIQAQLWDFAGEKRFRFILPRYCKGAVGGLLLFDLSRYSTTKYIKEWYDIWKNNAPKGAPLSLVGTKLDLLTTKEELEQAEKITKELAKDLGIEKYYLISSKTGKDVAILTNDLLVDGYCFNVKLIEEMGEDALEEEDLQPPQSYTEPPQTQDSSQSEKKENENTNAPETDSSETE